MHEKHAKRRRNAGCRSSSEIIIEDIDFGNLKDKFNMFQF